MTQSFKAAEAAKLHSATSRIEQRMGELKRVDVEVDERVCQYQQQHAGISYSDALTEVLAADGDLAKRYNESFVGRKDD